MQKTRVFDGKFYPDKVSRRLILSEGLDGPEAHLVPVEENHTVGDPKCDCGASKGFWGGHKVIYHHPEPTRIPVPDFLPPEI